MNKTKNVIIDIIYIHLYTYVYLYMHIQAGDRSWICKKY